MGGWSTGGGDPVYDYIIDAKQAAPALLRSLNPNQLKRVTRSAASKWLLEDNHIERLATEIEASPFSVTGDKDTCAWTTFRQKAEVVFTVKHCHGTLTSTEEAEKWWIHEAAHHLEVPDDVLATEIGHLVLWAWGEMKFQKIPMCPDNRNIVSSILIGHWRESTTVNQALEIPLRSGKQISSVSFSEDARVLEMLPPIGYCAYRVGYLRAEVDGRNLEFPYALISKQGQPVVVYFEREADGSWDQEYLNLYAIRKRRTDPESTVLLLGGDHDEEGFTAFERAKAPL